MNYREQSRGVRFIWSHGRAIPISAKESSQLRKEKKPVGVTTSWKKVSAAERAKPGLKKGAVFGGLAGVALGSTASKTLGKGRGALLGGAIAAAGATLGAGVSALFGPRLRQQRDKVFYRVVDLNGKRIVQKSTK